MTLAVGTKLGRYEILAPLGAGGMGEVYRARDESLGREVAVKVLPSLLPDAEARSRFAREAQAAGALDHPGIVVVHDVGAHDGAPYVVMELLQGATLRERLSEGPLPIETAVQWARALAEALGAAHARGIVHRDLKPENVFVTKDGRVKVLDFGLARTEPQGEASDTAPTAPQLTEPGTALGTVGYMAPEQLRGQRTGPPADVFALGAVIFEMVTGRRAFARPTRADTLSAILNEDPPEVSSARRGAPEGLSRAVTRCLSKDSSERFASGAELARALQDLEAPSVTRPERRGRRAFFLVVVCAAVLLAAGAALLLARRPSRVESIAVLPLADFSQGTGQEYFSDGMTEALIADLAQIRSLRVISRTSVMPYKTSKKPLRAIGRELGVDALVEGSVLRAGDRVRITAQLVDARSDRHLWARSYERPLKDVLALQSEVALAVTREIAGKLSPADEARLGPRPVDPDAYEAYLKGRYLLNQGTEANIRSALQLFAEAMERDPGSALPYTGVADAYSLLRSVYASPNEVMPKAKAAAKRAVELDETLPAAHVSLGNAAFFYDFDWAAAEKEYRRALELNPSSGEAHDAYAGFLSALGRHAEAFREIDRAVELDPLSSLVRADAAWVAYIARAYPRAVEAAREAVRLAPDSWWAHACLGLAYEKTGRLDDAVAELGRARAIDDNTTVLEMLGGAYATAGRKVDAAKVLETLSERAKMTYVCPYEVATVYAGIGERGRAIEWLFKSKDERADCLPWAGGDSKVDAVRDDPRFQELLRSIRLPAAAR